jgi:hypothetical protein
MPSAPDHFQPYEGEEPYLFISYARKDLDSLQPILQSLARRGVRLWWDLGLHAGEDYAERLEQRVNTCAGLVVFLSRNATRKKSQNWVLSETKHAAEAGKEIVPAMLEDFALPLEWKALVEHRQVVSVIEADGEIALQGIVSRAQALRCIQPQDATPPVRGKRGTTKDFPRRPAKGAWLDPCMQALSELRQILESLSEAEGADPVASGVWDAELDYGDETDEPPDNNIALPLTVDTDKRYSRCQELIAAADGLLDPQLPVAERLTNCLRLTERFPASKDGSLGLALGLCHLYHLVALVQIHADAHEVPGTETIGRLNRASVHLTGTRPSATVAAVLELLQLVRLSLDIARLELPLMAGLPDSKSLGFAETKGVLAYSSEWRGRIASAEALEHGRGCFTFSQQRTDGVVADAFHSKWTLGEWIVCGYRDLMRPGSFCPLPTQPITQAPSMQRRGADLAIRVRKRIAWASFAKDLSATGKLLYHCFRPLGKPVWGWQFDFEWEAAQWMIDVSHAANAGSAAVTDCLRTPECCVLLTALLRRHHTNRLWFRNYSSTQEFDRDALVRRLGQEFALQGSTRADRWVPTGWMSDARTRVFLWDEARRAIVEDLPFADDMLSLAIACDPTREAIPAAGSIRFLLPTDQRVAEILAAPKSMELRRAGWLQPQCYCAPSDQLVSGVRALFGK